MNKIPTIDELLDEEIANRDVQDNQQLITELFKKEDPILLIGSEAILNNEDKTIFTQGTGDIMYYIYNKLADNYRRYDDRSSRPTTEQQWLKAIQDKKNDCIEFWRNLEIEEKKKLMDNLEPSLLELLKNYQFKVILTTCVDNLLELKLKTMPSYGSVKVYNFMNIQEVTSFINDWNNYQENPMIEKPVSLIYLYGRIRKKDSRIDPFVFTEDEAIKAITDYIQMKNENTKKLFDEIIYKHSIISIGCRHDDWRFRFLWYTLRGIEERLKDGTVAFTCATESDHNLIDYLKREQVLVDTDSRRLMRRMNLLITNKDNLEVLLQRRRNGAGGIFLSYKSEDFNNVYRWFTKLTAKRFNVWLDHKALHTWDEYNEKIKESIDACPIFMPILTQAVAEDLRNRAKNTSFLKPGDEGYHFYIDEEWRHAIESKKQIRPVIIGAYDYRCSEYHNRFINLMNLSANDISLKSADTDDANIIDDLTTIVTQMH